MEYEYLPKVTKTFPKKDSLNLLDKPKIKTNPVERDIIKDNTQLITG